MQRLRYFFKHHHTLFAIFVTVALILLYTLTPVGNGSDTAYLGYGSFSDDIRTLRRLGYRTTAFDRLWGVFNASTHKAGWYRIDMAKTHMRPRFFASLYDTPAATMRVRIYGGDSIEDMLRRLANDTKLDEAHLRNAYDALHIKPGEILAGDFVVARKADARALLEGLRTLSLQRIDALFRSVAQNAPLSRNEIFIVASVIQKETNHPEEMPKIASVIYNRLDKGMKLQMDGTLNYGPYSHTPVTPERIKNDQSRYNTYIHHGLPPQPVGIFSQTALQAALNPADTPYVYFMLQSDGKHRFSQTYEEHMRYLRKFKETTHNKQ